MPGRFIILSVLILVGAAFAYLTGNSVAPLFDRDEPRYAITSRNMLTTGDYVVPRQYDAPRTAKPPMIYWVQAASMRVFGETSSMAARLPSSAAMLGVVVALLLFLRGEADEETALAATTIFAFAGLTGFLAKFAITDSVLLLSVAASMGCVYRLWRGDRGWGVVLVWAVATGVAGLTKGPVVIGVQGMTLAALFALSLLDRKFAPVAPWWTHPYPPADRKTPGATWVKLLVAGVLVLAIVLPWLVMVTQREPEFLSKALNHDIIKRSTRGVDGQARPPGFYLLTVFGTFFPWSILIPGALVLGWKGRHRPLTRFCLAMCVGPWVMFEASTSKMVHWFLPVFIPLSILCGEAIVRCWRGKHDEFVKTPFAVATAVWAVATVLVGLVVWVAVRELPPTQSRVAWAMTAWGLLMAGSGGWFWVRAGLGGANSGMARRANLFRGVAAMGVMMAVLFPLVFSFVVPRLWFMQLGRSVGEDLRGRGAVGVGNVVMVGFREPSLAFYQGGTIREAETGALATTAATWATVTQSVWSIAPDAARSRWYIVSSHSGIAYADKPEVIDVLILRRR